MKKQMKTGTVAFATASGFAVVHSPACQAGEQTPVLAKSTPKVTPESFPLTDEMEIAEAS